MYVLPDKNIYPSARCFMAHGCTAVQVYDPQGAWVATLLMRYQMSPPQAWGTDLAGMVSPHIWEGISLPVKVPGLLNARTPHIQLAT